METLTSLKNQKILAWRSLKDKKGREEQQAFLVEGVRMVREALSSSFTVKALLLREDRLPGDCRVSHRHPRRQPRRPLAGDDPGALEDPRE